MKTFVLAILSLGFFPATAQTQIDFKEPIKVVAVGKVSSNVKEGSVLYVTGIGVDLATQLKAVITINTKDQNGVSGSIDSDKIGKFQFDEIDNTDKVWNMYLLANDAYANILRNGFQYALRQDLNDEAIDFDHALRDQYFEDPFLEDYLYTLLTRVHTGILNDKRPGNIYVKVLKESGPNAFILPNGCIVITTGLLSTIQSEDELVGVLAHEVAHFVLDHHVMNYNKEIDRKRKAEFWAGFATAIAAGADVYMASSNKNHIPGVLTVSTAVVASAFANEAIVRLGIKYNQEQEIEADNVSKQILRVLNYDTLGLSVALQRIREYCILTGDYLALTGSGTHPSINSRIKNLGKPTSLGKFVQTPYLRKVSSVNSFSAEVELWGLAHHESAEMLADRNILNGVAIESDYIVKAVVKRRHSNSRDSNQEVLALLHKAKSLNVSPRVNISKEEGITWLRLGNKVEAKKAFQTYLTSLLEIKERMEKLEYPNNNIEGLPQEIDWARKMIFKVDSF